MSSRILGSNVGYASTPVNCTLRQYTPINTYENMEKELTLKVTLLVSYGITRITRHNFILLTCLWNNFKGLFISVFLKNHPLIFTFKYRQMSNNDLTQGIFVVSIRVRITQQN